MKDGELEKRCHLYKAFILALLQEHDLEGFTITGAALMASNEQLITAFNYEKDTVTVLAAPEETKRLIS